MNVKMKSKLDIQKANNFHQFIGEVVLLLTSLGSQKLCFDMQFMLNELLPRNRSLLNKQQQIQSQIEQWP